MCEKACATYASDLKFREDIKIGNSEGEPNDTILADVFEAFIGAMYLDLGFEETKRVVLNIVLKYIEKGINFLKDYKSELQELVQTVKKSITYETINIEGPSHNRTFTCVAIVDGIVMGEGKGNSKKAAEQEAAKAALEKRAEI